MLSRDKLKVNSLNNNEWAENDTEIDEKNQQLRNFTECRDENFCGYYIGGSLVWTCYIEGTYYILHI